MDLKGRRVLVTGASRGIGEATARAFAAAGATVALVARDAEALDSLATDLGGTFHPCDLADPAATAALVPTVEASAGPVDVLVNNAGLAPGWSRNPSTERRRDSMKRRHGALPTSSLRST